MNKPQKTVRVLAIMRGKECFGSTTHCSRVWYLEEDRLRGRNSVRHRIRDYSSNGEPFRWVAFGRDGGFIAGESRLTMADKWKPIPPEEPHPDFYEDFDADAFAEREASHG